MLVLELRNACWRGWNVRIEDQRAGDGGLFSRIVNLSRFALDMLHYNCFRHSGGGLEIN